MIYDFEVFGDAVLTSKHSHLVDVQNGSTGETCPDRSLRGPNGRRDQDPCRLQHRQKEARQWVYYQFKVNHCVKWKWNLRKYIPLKSLNGYSNSLYIFSFLVGTQRNGKMAIIAQLAKDLTIICFYILTDRSCLQRLQEGSKSKLSINKTGRS